MNSATVTTSNEAFEPNLKKDPRLVYRKFRARLIYEVSTLCNDITQNRGLIFFLFSLIMFRALPGNTTQDAAGNDVFVAGYDIVAAIVFHSPLMYLPMIPCNSLCLVSLT
jgi:hypothetical protein